MTETIVQEGGKVDLEVDTRKIETMKIKTEDSNQVEIESETLQEVEKLV